MISIHPAKFKDDRLDRYSAGWVLPWHPDVRCRGSFINPCEMLSMYDLMPFITQYMWSPIIWKKLIRNKNNFAFTSLCVFDFDGTETLEYGLKTFKNYTHLIGTTRNHQKNKKGITCDRYRVLIPFKEPIVNLRQFEYNMKKFISRFNSDSQPKDGARMYIPCTEIVSINEGGNSMDVWDLPPNKDNEFILTPIDPKKITYSVGLFMRYGAYEDGKRHDVLYKVAADMTRQGKNKEEIFLFIEPKTNLDEKEIQSVIDSAHKRYASVAIKD